MTGPSEPEAGASDSSEQGQAEASPVASRVAELEEKVAAQAAKLDEVLRAYSRLQQEREDFRRRLERDRERLIDVERGNVALGLLEAVDELDRSLASAPPECAALVEGVRLIRDGLLRRSIASGIQRMPVLGEPFNPTLHEAVEVVPCERVEDDERVVEEIRPGYRHGDRVIRPARVRVGRFSAARTKRGNGSSHHKPSGRVE